MLRIVSGIMIAFKLMGLTTISWWLALTPMLIGLGLKLILLAINALEEKL